MHSKMQYFTVRAKSVLAIILITIALVGCGNAKKVTYFQDISDSLYHPMYRDRIDFKEPVIQANDILTVQINTLDPENTLMFNASALEGDKTQNAKGYMVSKEGTIELPLIGNVIVGGLTTTQAKDLIKERVTKYYKDPVVNVRFANFTVMMLGEVNQPGPLTVSNEKMSIVDAIALSGDLGIQGKRNNIMLIREENGKKTFVRFNMNSTEIYKSPYFYLKSGDVVYVEPNVVKKRAATYDATRDKFISYLISATTLFTSIYIITTRNN
jgi:polysaccharide export outer membrane protein